MLNFHPARLYLKSRLINNSTMLLSLLLIFSLLMCPTIPTNSYASAKLIEKSVTDYHSNCNIVICDPTSLTQAEMDLFHDYFEDRAKVLISFDNTRVTMDAGKTKCQILVQGANNVTTLTMVDSLFHSTRTPTKVVVLSGKREPILTQNKFAYDIDIISTTSAKMTRYLVDKDFRWKQLEVSYTEFAPYLFTSVHGSLSGITIDIWKIFSAKLGLNLNFSKKVATYADGYKSLAMNEVDLALPQDSMWTTMFQIADATPFLFFEKFTFYNIKPGPVGTLLTLFYPFDGLVWVFALLSFMFTLIAICLINIKTTVTRFHAVQILFSAILSDTVSNQINKYHKNWYGYVVLSIWLLSGLVLSSAYSSNLLANLTVVEKNSADNTFEDLLKNKRTLGLPKGTFVEDWMKNSPIEVVRRVEKECVQDRDGYFTGLHFQDIPPDLQDKIERGQASSLMMVSLFPSVQYKYRLGQDVLMDSFSTYYLQRRHPMKNQVDKLLPRLTDSGITLHIKDRYLWDIARPGRDYERTSTGNDATTDVKISPQHLYPLWILNMAGLTVSLVAFLNEWCSGRKLGMFRVDSVHTC